jgi:hypothetical protein
MHKSPVKTLLGLASVVSLLAAAPAQAKETNAFARGHAAELSFNSSDSVSHDQLVGLSDDKPDGHSAVGIIQIQERERWIPLDTIWDTRGSNSAALEKRYHIRHGVLVRIRACLGESGSESIFGCSKWKVTHA